MLSLWPSVPDLSAAKSLDVRSSAVPLGRDEIANMAVRDAREIVGFLDDTDEISADGDEGGVFLLALGVLALE